MPREDLKESHIPRTTLCFHFYERNVKRSTGMQDVQKRLQRWNSQTEFLVESYLSFLLVFYPHFSILQNAIDLQTQFFSLRGCFCKDF
jgi:hypothetical protein